MYVPKHNHRGWIPWNAPGPDYLRENNEIEGLRIGEKGVRTTKVESEVREGGERGLA